MKKKQVNKAIIQEQFRMLRTNIYYASSEKAKVITVTSPGSDEGKTTTAVNLAKTLVVDNYSVLLIDCDLRRPSVSKYFEINNDKGLTNVIVNEEDIFTAIHKDVDIEGLDIITSGVIPPNPAEILHSKKFQDLIKTFRSCYDYIVIDTPPILVATDAVLVGKESDGALMVISSKKTPSRAAQKATQVMKRADVKILGAVLNNISIKEKNYYNYYVEDKGKGKIKEFQV